MGLPASVGGGWVAALQAALTAVGGVELAVGFPWEVSRVRLIEDGDAVYLPFPRWPRGGRLRRLLADLTCRLEPAGEVDHLERVVELSRPDLIHVWGTEAFYGLVGERSAQPLLIELQGLRQACTEAYLSAFGKLDLLRHGSPRRLLAGRSLLHRYYRYRRSAARERRILARARFVSGRTEWDRAESARLAPAARYFHCDRLLRPPFYEAAWRPRPPGGPLRLVSVLRGNAYKGMETVARCAERLADLPGGVEWTVVGIRPGEEIVRVVEGALGLSLSALGVRLAGRQPAEEVVRRLLASDLFAFTSWIENSPNGLCEAMLLGLPIVSTDVGGIPSLIAHGEEGLLVPPGDAAALAGSIRRLAGDRRLAEALAAAARRRALARHDPPRVARSLRDIYRQVLADAGRPAAGTAGG